MIKFFIVLIIFGIFLGFLGERLFFLEIKVDELEDSFKSEEGE